MTEESSVKDDDYLVRVKAQVMTRDDSSGGWVPMGGGGMSIVGLRKLVIPGQDDVRHEYLIHGERIADQSVVLNCILKKDVQYVRVNPTFHHWKTEEKRFGLTFQSSADARAFDKGVKRAVEDILEGSPDSHTHDLELGDDDVFMTLDLPLGRKDSSSHSVSTASTTTSSPSPASPVFPVVPGSLSPNCMVPPHHHQHLHRVHYLSRQGQPRLSGLPEVVNRPPEDVWIKAEKNGQPPPGQGHTSPNYKGDHHGSSMEDNIELVDYSYVQFAQRPSTMHEYSYPTLPQAQRSHSISQLKKQQDLMATHQPPLPTKSKKKKKDRPKRDKRSSRKLLSPRSRCVYCNEMFCPEDNSHGACEDAPDKVAQHIERVSCICCARGLLYHCMADTDGDYGHPCVCDTAEHNNCKKWSALTVLALFVPCLWCYWPLTACHRCGVAARCCGGRHKAA